MIDQSRLKRLSVILFILALVMLIVHMESLLRFNRRVFHIHGNDAGAMSKWKSMPAWTARAAG